jgi:hypothetical protein
LNERLVPRRVIVNETIKRERDNFEFGVLGPEERLRSVVWIRMKRDLHLEADTLRVDLVRSPLIQLLS